MSCRGNAGSLPLRCRPPRKRGTQYAAASRLKHDCLWNTGSPAFAGDDTELGMTTLPDPRRRPLLHPLLPPEHRRRLARQRGEHEGHHVLEPLVAGGLGQQIAAEDEAERRVVGEIEEAQTRDRDVELYGIDGDREVAAGNAALHDLADHLDEGRM